MSKNFQLTFGTYKDTESKQKCDVNYLHIFSRKKKTKHKLWVCLIKIVSPFLSSNIPSDDSYSFYISQLIRYARCCSYYDDFIHRHKMLVERLVSQGYRHERLRNSFKKFYGRYQDLIVKYQRSVSDIRTHSLLTPNSNWLSLLIFF